MAKSFADLGVPEDLLKGLRARGIENPFPIQEATLTDALDGRDVCGKAPTGSGKTLAFSIPLVSRVDRARPRKPRGLVLVPTRELAAQVQEVIEPLSRVRRLSVASIYGGVGFEKQIKSVRKGVDIVVACPGRLNDLLERGEVSLEDVTFAVIDEADRMADMGFLPDVRRILDRTKKSRQTLLFSATLDGDVDVLVKRYQRDPVRHDVTNDEDEEDTRLHLFWKVAREARVAMLTKVLNHVGPAIIFTRTKRGADRLSTQLQNEGVKVAAIHGGRTQPQRDRSLAAFVQGRVQVLVATDVAARGIHVDDVDCVVHFDVPDDVKAYVHRSGRTARAGANGTVITFVGPDGVGAITQMQRRLLMPAGVIDPDFRALPEPGSRPRSIAADHVASIGGKPQARGWQRPPRSARRRPRNGRRPAA